MNLLGLSTRSGLREVMNRRRGALVFTRSAFLFCAVPLLDPGNGVFSGIVSRLSGDLANMANDMSYSTVSITYHGYKVLTDPARRTKMLTSPSVVVF